MSWSVLPVLLRKKSIDRCRVQPIECIPVSTTSRTARHLSYVNWPHFAYGSLYSPRPSPSPSQYTPHPPTNADSPFDFRHSRQHPPSCATNIDTPSPSPHSCPPT